MKIKNWIAWVQDRGKWKEVVEKAKTFNQEVQRLEEEEEEEKEEEELSYRIQYRPSNLSLFLHYSLTSSLLMS